MKILNVMALVAVLTTATLSGCGKNKVFNEGESSESLSADGATSVADTAQESVNAEISSDFEMPTPNDVSSVDDFSSSGETSELGRNEQGEVSGATESSELHISSLAEMLSAENELSSSAWASFSGVIFDSSIALPNILFGNAQVNSNAQELNIVFAGSGGVDFGYNDVASVGAPTAEYSNQDLAFTLASTKDLLIIIKWGDAPVVDENGAPSWAEGTFGGMSRVRLSDLGVLNFDGTTFSSVVWPMIQVEANAIPSGVAFDFTKMRTFFGAYSNAVGVAKFTNITFKERESESSDAAELSSMQIIVSSESPVSSEESSALEELSSNTPIEESSSLIDETSSLESQSSAEELVSSSAELVSSSLVLSSSAIESSAETGFTGDVFIDSPEMPVGRWGGDITGFTYAGSDIRGRFNGWSGFFFGYGADQDSIVDASFLNTKTLVFDISIDVDAELKIEWGPRPLNNEQCCWSSVMLSSLGAQLNGATETIRWEMSSVDATAVGGPFDFSKMRIFFGLHKDFSGDFIIDNIRYE